MYLYVNSVMRLRCLVSGLRRGEGWADSGVDVFSSRASGNDLSLADLHSRISPPETFSATICHSSVSSFVYSKCTYDPSCISEVATSIEMISS